MNRCVAKMALVFLTKVLRGIGNILLALVVAHAIGSEGTGDYFLAVTCILLVSQFAQLGLHQAAIKYFPGLKSQGDEEGLVRMFIIMAMLTFVVSSVVAICLYVYGERLGWVLFGKTQVGKLLEIMSPVIVAWAMIRLSVSAWQALGNMGGIAIYENVVLPCLLISGGIYVLISQGDEIHMAWMTSVAYLVVSIVILVRTPRMIFSGRSMPLAKRLSLYLLPVSLVEMLRFAFPVLAIGIMQQLVLWTDTLMMGALRSSHEVGVYAAAARVAIISTILLYVVNTVYAPRISEYCAGGRWRELRREYGETVFAMAIISVPIFFAMMIGSPWLMRLFGEEFFEGRFILVILLLGQLVNVLTGPAGYLMILSGKERIEGLNIAATVVINVLLNALLIPRLGGAGAAIATAVSLALVNVARAYQNRMLAGIPWIEARYLRAWIVFLPVMGVSGLALYLGAIGYAFVASIMGAVIYMLFMMYSSGLMSRIRLINQN